LLEEGAVVLNSGCRPATWTLEMAEAFHNSKFRGIDISFVSPELIMSTNVELFIGNITRRSPFPNNTFDYIHQRLLMASLTFEIGIM
jgi:hypothetical protein